MQKIKQILINKATLAFLLGGIVVYCSLTFLQDLNKKITFLSAFELNQTIPGYLYIRGSYADNGELNSINLDCDMDLQKCIESSFFVTKEGVAGLGVIKEYKIVESTPSKVMAIYEGLGAIHSFIIELDKNLVTFKNQSKSNSSDVGFYVLEDGRESLKKAQK